MAAPFIKSSFSSAATCAEAAAVSRSFLAHDYDLAATLSSGQTFRWQLREGWWEGVIGARWVRLRAETDLQTGRLTGPPTAIIAETAETVNDWRWLADYLQIELNLAEVLRTFPEDQPMRLAVAACRGLRLVRQDPWECLASFILSSSKQIVQIQQIVTRLCERFGEQVIVPQNHQPVYCFPLPGCIAAAGESELRACKMGFRAPNLLASAQMIAEGTVDLSRLSALPVGEARDALMRLPGVGRKIADCVLLFAYGFQDAFPVDVWVMKAMRRLYFPRRQVSLKRLQEFAAAHFGPCAGYAQQYLFHYARIYAKLND